jgi:hypothetical protein
MWCKNPRCNQQVREWSGVGTKPEYCSKACKNRLGVIKRRDRLKQLVIASKGGRCERCGYDRCIRALEFHHKDPSTKEFKMSDARTRSLERMLVEAKKCILVCSNCHAEIEEEKDKERWLKQRPEPS